MKIFCTDGDNKRLYFKNFSHKSDDEERDEILKILTSASATIEKPFMGPDCDLYKGKIEGKDFSIIYSIDGDGTFLYVDDETTLVKLQEIFNIE